ncbi:hypothetical protein TNCV_4984621 [Trichonephila clavipes]|nr:hypothetical protein TNCV_4984621 [Trichonephila clavipes]
MERKGTKARGRFCRKSNACADCIQGACAIASTCSGETDNFWVSLQSQVLGPQAGFYRVGTWRHSGFGSPRTPTPRCGGVRCATVRTNGVWEYT